MDEQIERLEAVLMALDRNTQAVILETVADILTTLVPKPELDPFAERRPDPRRLPQEQEIRTVVNRLRDDAVRARTQPEKPQP